MWTELLLISLVMRSAYGSTCEKKVFDQDSFVCVCKYGNGNGRYICDTVEPESLYNKNTQALVYSTSAKSDRLTKKIENFSLFSRLNSTLVVELDSSVRYQTIVGFGGAITDAVEHVSRRTHLYDLLIDQYYGPGGIDYSLGRVPIGSTDFSLGEWSYAESDQDFELRSFNVDRDGKISLINDILRKTPNLTLFASPWSPPGWMKENGRMKGGSRLKQEYNGVYYLAFAKYFVNFFNEYFKKGIKFWGVTVVNEPIAAGTHKDWTWQALDFSSATQRDFVNVRLGPLLRNNLVTKDIKIMAHDDQRSLIFDAAKEIYGPKDKLKFEVDGLGVHWYSKSPFEPLEDTHNLRPDKFILATEACNAFYIVEHVPLLGSWEYAANYAHDIIQNLLYHVVGWTDWNIWLDEQGGPNWAGNFVDAPIIVDTLSKDQFYKQPMYYIMGHFSKFIRPGSVRVKTTLSQKTNDVEAVGFVRPDGSTVVVVHNRHQTQPFKIGVKSKNAKTILKLELEPKSIKTIIYKEN